MRTAILHTQSGAKLPVDFKPLYPNASNRQLAQQVKTAVNEAGMLDKVVFVEIL